MSPAPGAQLLHIARARAWKGHDEDTKPATMKSSTKQRDPPPALFLAPSPAASHVSLPGLSTPSNVPQAPANSRRDQTKLDIPGVASRVPSGGSHRKSHARVAPSDTGRGSDRTDALWAEMQATLEEVELSASGGTHVFGPGHDKKLEDLRAAQIALAQAWARSEADDTVGATMGEHATSTAQDEVGNLKTALGDDFKLSGGDTTEAGRSTAASGSGRPASSGADVERLGSKLEEETESDILLARKRREANDQYFQRVNNGVLDVVDRLENVAVAMHAVEMESQEIWEDGSSSQHSRA